MPTPVLCSTFSVAGIGPVSISTGSAPVTAPPRYRTMGVRPSDTAFSAVITSSAAAPSEICDELPAWITPSSWKAGFRPASFSAVVPRRMPSSSCTTAPSSVNTGTIWS